MENELTARSNEDELIFSCLNLEEPKSFFLFAGAGSGKTRSLVNALINIKKHYGVFLRINRKKVGVITYTNAACDEIKHRIEYDSLFFVSTIHSFVWELIKPYQADIREWLRLKLSNDIAELQNQIQKGRPGTKTAIDKQTKLEQKTSRLSYLNKISEFIYSPTGDNRTRDSLNHSEVIEIASGFLRYKPLMQEILIRKFPILFIDESQDTKKELIESLFIVQQRYATSFCLGLFGDTMQRIYMDGKENLGSHLPSDWVKPVKKINYRCPIRVVSLINQIRSTVDKQIQIPKEGQLEGIVRLFIVPRTTANKNLIEANIVKLMAQYTNDTLWDGMDSDVKVLTLEHHMAARRMGFIKLFEALSSSDILRTGLIDGTLAGLRFFTQLILPLRMAYIQKDNFAIARIVKANSPLLTEKVLKSHDEQTLLLKKANESVISLNSLWEDSTSPNLIKIILNIQETGLFALPDSLSLIGKRKLKEQQIIDENGENKFIDSTEEKNAAIIAAWDEAVSCSFDEIEKYNEYVSDSSRFGTHQGVKGLEFSRVMVILDDEEARGFLFSYEKLFGVKAPTAADLKNGQDGKETSNDRTMRLFYVACSRAEKSLAIVAYSENPMLLKNHVLKQNWFLEDEIVMM